MKNRESEGAKGNIGVSCPGAVGSPPADRLTPPMPSTPDIALAAIAEHLRSIAASLKDIRKILQSIEKYR